MTTTANRTVTAVETYSGRYVDLLNPDPETICLADIAVGLSNACRFVGQVSRPYNVAEHSVRATWEAERMLLSPAARLGTLLHDAHEAYTGDLSAPFKHALEQLAPGAVKKIQGVLDVAIGLAFDISPEMFKLPVVKLIDDAVMFREAAGLKYSHGIGEHWGNTEYHEPLVAYGWTPAEAERRFIETYERLTNGNNC